MCYKKAAPLNYSKNAFCLLYSDKAWRRQIFICSDIWLHRPLILRGGPVWGLLTLSSRNTEGQRLSAVNVQLVRCQASRPRRRSNPKRGFSVKSQGLTKPRRNWWTRGHRNCCFWNCASVHQGHGAAAVCSLTPDCIISTVCTSLFGFVCVFWTE